MSKSPAFAAVGATRDGDQDSGWLQHERLGYNYRLSEVNCALDVGQLARLETIPSMRRQVAPPYDRILGEVDAIVLPRRPLDPMDMSWFV